MSTKNLQLAQILQEDVRRHIHDCNPGQVPSWVFVEGDDRGVTCGHQSPHSGSVSQKNWAKTVSVSQPYHRLAKTGG